MRGEKSGQFYLIATIIIIAVVIGFVTISNYAQKQNSVKIYDLGEELNIEGESVLDYGIYNGLDKSATAELLKDFIETYSEYLGGDIEIYLIVGDDESLIVIGQEEGLEEDLEVDFGLTGNAIQSLKKFAKKEFTPKLGDYYDDDPEGSLKKKRVNVKIKNKQDIDKSYEYEFELKEGENFYFIISQQVGEETHVTTN